MSEFMSVLKGRRSIRHFQDREIPKDILDKILESVRWSPSWANTQCWEVIVVRDQVTKEKLQETINKTNPAKKAVAQAPLVIVLWGKLNSSGYYKGEVTTKFGDWFMFDLGLATQSLCLTAHNLGLGTVIVGLFDHDKAKKIFKLGDDYELVALIPIGYPAKDSPAPKRREISEFTHYDTI